MSKANGGNEGNMEDAKNMALLFFMDHLMAKSGERTIHDLSCQFGARGFSAEMREAVGNTQEGLQEFLAQYPSLFKVDGDTVTVNGYGELGGGAEAAMGGLLNLGARDRDYVAESIAFFEAKLRKFGPEMQIKSLLGHRSQAAPEVRVVSGRHVKDFTDFLYSHPDHFVVEGERVRLAQMPEPKGGEAECDESGAPLSGARAKAAAVEYMREVLENQELPMPMDSLYTTFCERFSHAVRQDVATNPKELLSFLKLNRNIFFIRSNKVSLVRIREGDGEGGESDASGTSSSGGGVENILSTVTVLKALRAAQTAVQELAASTAPPIVALDFKTVSLGSGGEFLSLVLVKTPEGRILVFDVSLSDAILRESGLQDLLESPEWLKVLHDGKRVSALLAQHYGIHLQGLFDTQVGNWVLQQQKSGRPLEEMRGLPFSQLQRVYAPESLMLSDLSPAKSSQRLDPAYWSQRPLSDEALRLAVEEVRVLVPHIYNAISTSMRPESQALFHSLCGIQASAPTAALSVGGGVGGGPVLSAAARPFRPAGTTAPLSSSPCTCACSKTKATQATVATQTFSTGDITVSKVYRES